MEISGQFHALARFTPWYRSKRKLSVPQSRSGRGGEEKKSLPSSSAVNRTRNPARSLVTTLTELFRLLNVTHSGSNTAVP